MKQEMCVLADVPARGSILVPFFGREVHVRGAGPTPRNSRLTCLSTQEEDGKLHYVWGE